MMTMPRLLPVAWMPYAKAWVSLLGVIAATIVAAWGAAPTWVGIAGAVLTSIGVYLAPNTSTKGGKHAADQDQP